MSYDKKTEEYLGDGLYVSYDGYTIWLRAPRAGGDHYVGLEPEIWKSLEEYTHKVWGK